MRRITGIVGVILLISLVALPSGEPAASTMLDQPGAITASPGLAATLGSVPLSKEGYSSFGGHPRWLLAVGNGEGEGEGGQENGGDEGNEKDDEDEFESVVDELTGLPFSKEWYDTWTRSFAIWWDQGNMPTDKELQERYELTPSQIKRIKEKYASQVWNKWQEEVDNSLSKEGFGVKFKDAQTAWAWQLQDARKIILWLYGPMWGEMIIQEQMDRARGGKTPEQSYTDLRHKGVDPDSASTATGFTPPSGWVLPPPPPGQPPPGPSN